MNYTLMEGVVVDTNDPQQMGRVKIWVPALDGDGFEVKNLPWARYMSPLAGQTRDYPAGPGESVTKGFLSYGWWAVPKNGALVVVGLLYDDPNQRVYIGSYFREHGNRSLPQGRWRPDIEPDTPLSDTFEPVQPEVENLKAQFSGQLGAPEALSRGVYERQVAQDKTIKDGGEGYQVDLVEPKDEKGNPLFDPQTYVLTSPGRHSVIMQDNPENGRLRLKTAAGHQVILDDANERIYVSTSRGETWIELDQDGRVHVYAGDSISMTTGGDFNVSATGNINMQAGKNVNVQAGGEMRLAACGSAHLSGNGVNLESQAGFNILAAANLIQTGANIHLNGPQAESATCPDTPDTVPQHEPWTRKASKHKRGKHWKA